MAQDRTLLAWPDLLRQLLEYFSNAPLSFKRGGRRGLFFFFFFSFRFDLSALTGSTYPMAFTGPLGSPRPLKGL